ncbi:MAG: histidine kinase [Flavobacteriales bacterium]|nr:histidine kinase [Flavobacteriales bacterium]MCB9446726.1 histidine kinase [Flavobacteriales bacterium]
MRAGIRIISLFLILLPASGQLFGQTHNFRNYSVKEGLPFIHVYEIFQDSKGYLWSGGYGGMSRFDGLDFRNFSEKDGLASYWVTSFAEDHEGNLWIGTLNGLNCSRHMPWPNMPIQLNTYRTTEGLPDNQINYLLYDTHSRLWVATPKGMGEWKDSTFTPAPAPLGNGNILKLRAGWNNDLWVGTDDGLYHFANNIITPIQLPAGVDGPKTTALFCDTIHKVLYVGRGSQISVLKENAGQPTVENIILPEGFQDATVLAFAFDIRNQCWVGTNKGLFLWHGGNDFEQYVLKDDINAALVQTLFKDREGNLWIGTYDGLFRYRTDEFVTYQKKDGLKSSFVYEILRDRKNRLWYANKQGIQYMVGKRVVTPPLPTCDAWSLHEDTQGNIWAGTDKGLLIYNPQTGTHTRYDKTNGLRSDSVTAICQVSDHEYWLGNHNSVTHMVKDNRGAWQFTSTDLHQGEKDYDVWNIMVDRDHNIWFGTFLGGVFRLKDGVWEDMTIQLGLHTNAVLSILQDHDGIYYLATMDGLCIYKPGTKPGVIGVKEGLSSGLLYTLLLDHQEKYLWIGSNQGLNRMDLRAWKQEGRIELRKYGYEEGFLGVETNGPSAWEEEDGSLWFGTVNGLIHFNPNAYVRNEVPASIHLTGLQLAYTDTFFRSPVQLPASQNNLTFHFQGICLTRPTTVKYRYKLEGFEKEWSPATSDRMARYPNIPPGRYTFRVQCSNNEGIWGVKEATFRFLVDKPFYLQWWFVVLTVLVIGGTIFTLVRYRIRTQQKREREKAENEIRLATQELKAIRAQLNPHFIFNALNSIQHFVLMHHDESAGKYLNKFARLMRQILSNSERSQVTIQEELNALQLYLELEVLRFEDKFSFSITVDPEIDTEYYEIPPLLLQPFVENAILHGLGPIAKGGKLEVALSKQGVDLHITITDNGVGRQRARELKSASSRKEHKSMGMSLSHDRVDVFNRVLNTTIRVEVRDLETDGKPSGTQVVIIIPIS